MGSHPSFPVIELRVESGISPALGVYTRWSGGEIEKRWEGKTGERE